VQKTPEQKATLETAFQSNPTPNEGERKALAAATKLTEQQINVGERTFFSNLFH
jgi:hypothetical protein